MYKPECLFKSHLRLLLHQKAEHVTNSGPSVLSAMLRVLFPFKGGNKGACSKVYAVESQKCSGPEVQLHEQNERVTAV